MMEITASKNWDKNNKTEIDLKISVYLSKYIYYSTLALIEYIIQKLAYSEHCKT